MWRLFYTVRNVIGTLGAVQVYNILLLLFLIECS